MNCLRLVNPAALGLALIIASGCATHRSAPPPSKAEQAAITPAQALQRLQSGNARFVAGAPLPRHWPKQRAETASAQYPFAVVLSCIDSRASSEIVFDQGLGDIFNVRVAGNIVDDDVLGSIEFACKVAGAKLIAVVGHSHCGAVKGACAGAQLGHLTGLLVRIQPSVAAARRQNSAAAVTDERLIEAVVELNVRHMLKQMREQSGILRELIDSGQIGVVGGVHDLGSGVVHFLNP